MKRLLFLSALMSAISFAPLVAQIMPIPPDAKDAYDSIMYIDKIKQATGQVRRSGGVIYTPQEQVIYDRAIILVKQRYKPRFMRIPDAKDAVDSINYINSKMGGRWEHYTQEEYDLNERAMRLLKERGFGPSSEPDKPSKRPDSTRKDSGFRGIDETEDVQALSEIDTKNIWQSNTDDQKEPMIILNPADSMNLVCSYLRKSLSDADYTTGVSRTLNQADNWSQAYISSRTYTAHGDPTVAFNTSGTGYLCHMDFERSAPYRSKIIVRKSSDKGATWQADSDSLVIESGSPSANNNSLYDKPWIVCDTASNSFYKNTVYVFWIKYTERLPAGGDTVRHNKSQVFMTYKRPTDLFWNTPKAISDEVIATGGTPTRYYAPYPVIDRFGILYVFWQKAVSTSSIAIMMNRSDNGGIAMYDDVGQQIISGIINVQGKPLAGLFKNAFSIPAATIKENDIYVVWAGMNSDSIPKPNVYYAKSSNSGSTWSATAVVTTVSVLERWSPAITTSSDGAVYVSFYERVSNVDYKTRVAIAKLGGFGFDRLDPGYKTSEFTPTNIFTGDYMGIAATKYNFFAAFPKFYTDNVLNINVNLMTVYPGVGVNAPPLLVSPKIDGLNYNPYVPFIAGTRHTLLTLSSASETTGDQRTEYVFRDWSVNSFLLSNSNSISIPIEAKNYMATYIKLAQYRVYIKNEFREPHPTNDANGGTRTNGGIVTINGSGYNTQTTSGQFTSFLDTSVTYNYQANEQQYGNYYRGFNPIIAKDGGWVVQVPGLADVREPSSLLQRKPRPGATYTAKYRNRYDVQFNAQYEFDPMGLALPPQQVWQYESGAPAAAQTPLYNSTSGASRQYDFQYWTNGITTTSLPAVTPTDNTSYTAFYKAHLLSSVPTATGGSGQRRLVQARNNSNSYYFVYESGNKIYVTHSTDGGSTWQPEKYIGIGKNPSLISIDNDGVMIVWLNHLLTDPSNSTLYRPDIQSRIFYSNGSPLTPTHSVCYTGNTDGSVGPADQPYTGIFGSIVSPTSNAHPVGVDLAVGNNPYGRLICWEAQGRAFNAQQNPNTTLLATARFYFCCNTYNENYWRQHNVVRTSSDSPPFTSLIYPAANADLNPTMDYIAPNLSENSKIKLAWQTYLPNGSATDPIMTAEITVNLDATAYSSGSVMSVPNDISSVISAQRPTVVTHTNNLVKYLAWEGYDYIPRGLLPNGNQVILYRSIDQSNTLSPVTELVNPNANLYAPSIHRESGGAINVFYHTDISGGTVRFSRLSGSTWTTAIPPASGQYATVAVRSGIQKYAYVQNSYPYRIQFTQGSTGYVADKSAQDNAVEKTSQTADAETQSGEDGSVTMPCLAQTSVRLSDTAASAAQFVELRLAETHIGGGNVGAAVLPDSLSVTPENILYLLQSRTGRASDSAGVITSKLEVRSQAFSELNRNVKVWTELCDSATNQVLAASEKTKLTASDTLRTITATFNAAELGVANQAVYVRVQVSGMKPKKTHRLMAMNHILIGGAQDNGAGQVQATVSNSVQTAASQTVASAAIPTVFGLSQNYPNPFNPTTVIKYGLPEAAKVSVRIYDMLGRVVSELVNETKAAGYYEARFDASRLSSGTYFYRLQAGSFVETKKMVLLK